MLKKKLIIWFEDSASFSLFVLGLAAVIAALQLYFRPLNAEGYTAYNNFMIFRSSAELFWSQKNIYLLQPQHFFDHYKYSPFFAFLMTPFLWLPIWLGLVVFALGNVWAFWKSLSIVPELNPYKINVIMFFSSFELLGSIQNMQTNALLAGLFIASFQMARQQKIVSTVSLSALNFFLKIFGGLSFVFIVFIKGFFGKLKHLGFSILAFLLAIGLPVALTSKAYQEELWRSWVQLLQQDQATNIGYSLQGLLFAWFDFKLSALTILAAGLVLLVIVLLRISWTAYQNTQQNLALLGLMLVWLILFNPRSESPSFVIATAGIAIGFIAFSVTSRWAWWLCFTCTSLVHSDFMPQVWRVTWVEPYLIKVIPSFLVFFWLLEKLVSTPNEKEL